MLKPDSNPFGPYWYHNGTEVDELAANLFDRLTRIIIAILFMKIDPKKRFVQVDPAVFNALNETEKQVLISIQEWGSLLEVEEERTSRRARKNKEQAGDQNIDLNNITLKLIEETIINLGKLRSEIRKNGDYVNK